MNAQLQDPPSLDDARGLLTIGDLAARTGLAPATLRMWEQRHGFPEPRRLASGHRRYREIDVERVKSVMHKREAGVRLDVAISEAQRQVSASSQLPSDSLFAGLRREFPSLATRRLSKSALLGMSWAIEDELFALAQRSVMFGFFQKQRYFDAAQNRWRDLSRLNRATFAFADFHDSAARGDGIARVHLDEDSPVRREWSVLADGTTLPVVMTTAELPGQSGKPEQARMFEALWSTDPAVVRRASMLSLDLAQSDAPDDAAEVRAQLEEGDQAIHADANVVAGLHSRMIAYIDEMSVR